MMGGGGGFYLISHHKKCGPEDPARGMGSGACGPRLAFQSKKLYTGAYSSRMLVQKVRLFHSAKPGQREKVYATSSPRTAVTCPSSFW